MRPISRRTFLGAGAGVAGGLSFAEHLRFFEAGPTADADSAPPASNSAVFRTGHSNNCDGACGHLVHVTDTIGGARHAR